jgi:hypothetical protein
MKFKVKVEKMEKVDKIDKVQYGTTAVLLYVAAGIIIQVADACIDLACGVKK